MAQFSTNYYVDYENVDKKKIDADVNMMQLHMRNIYSLKLFYQYEENAFSSFVVKGPELNGYKITSIAQKPDQKSVLVKMDPNMYNNFFTSLDNVSGQVKTIIEKHKYQLKMRDFYLKHIIFHPIDEMTGKVLPGRKLSMFLQLYDKHYLPETIFYDVDGNIIDTTSLQDSNFTFIPLLHFFKVSFMSRTDAAIKIYIKEAIVTSIQ